MLFRSLESVEGQSALTMVASRSNIERYKELLENKIADMYKKATFQKKTIPVVSQQHMALLMEMNFYQKHLPEKYPELEIVLDDKQLEIRLEGPKDQVNIAAQECGKRQQAIIKKKLPLDADVLKILASRQGQMAIADAFGKQTIEAVYAFPSDQCSVEVLGSSNKHVQEAVSIIEKTAAEKKVLVKDKRRALLETQGWSDYIEKVKKRLMS